MKIREDEDVDHCKYVETNTVFLDTDQTVFEYDLENNLCALGKTFEMNMAKNRFVLDLPQNPIVMYVGSEERSSRP